MMNKDDIRKKFKKFFKIWDATLRAHATDYLDWELEEMENIFALITIGSLVGFPSPPIQITLELLPLMEKDLNIMLDKVAISHDAIGELFGVLGID